MPPVPVDALSPISEQFHAVSTLWFGQLFDMANWVFTALVTAEIVTTLMLRLGSGAFFWTILVDRLFRVCFFKFVLFNAGWLVPAVLNGFVYAGATAGGVEALNPQQVAVQGMVIATKLCLQMFNWGFWSHPMSLLMGFFCAAGIVASYALIAFQLMLALIESYIVTGAGVFMLGFGGWHGTSEIASRYISYIVAIGTKLFVMYLIIGAGMPLANIWAGMIRDVTVENFSTMIALAMGIGAFGLCVWEIPSFTSSLITGSLGLGLQDAIETTTVFARSASAVVAGPAVAAGAAAQAIGIGAETARLSGYGLRGALAGVGAMGGALGREAAAASVPRLSRGYGNLQKQHEALKKK